MESEQIHNVEETTQNGECSEELKPLDVSTKVTESISTEKEKQISSDIKRRKMDVLADSEQDIGDPSTVSDDNAIEMDEEEEFEDEVEEFEPIELMSRWTSRFVGGRLEHIHEVVCVPGTMWMLVYVAIYKLGKTFSFFHFCVQNMVQECHQTVDSFHQCNGDCTLFMFSYYC